MSIGSSARRYKDRLTVSAIGSARGNAADAEYDVFIGAVGYERRSRFILESLGPRAGAVVAAPFQDHRELSFEKNIKAFGAVGELLDGDERYGKELTGFLAERFGLLHRVARAEPRPMRIAVDISSMTRDRLAKTMRAVYVDSQLPLDVDWLYAPARYSTKLTESGAVQVNDAIPGYEGWGDPILPLHAIVGMGFEGDLVLGVLDDLEPLATWLFEPYGVSASYDRRIAAANQGLPSASSSARHFRYDVTQPYTSFLKLSAVVDDLIVTSRVVLLPLGPKIFALMCLLIGTGDDGNVTVWRLSADTGRAPVDRIPNGQILGLRGVLQK